MAKNLEAAQVVRGYPASSWSERPGLAKRVDPEPPRFRLAELAGRLVELSADAAPASLTLAMGLVLDAQRKGEPVAWISTTDSSFYPPDAAQSGVDLESLLVVRVAAGQTKPWIATSAERLLRSGAFGLVVLDLGKDATLPSPLQSRLLGLAQRHHAAVLCLTNKPESSPSLGSLVSLRAQAVRIWLGQDRFACELRVLKDKRRGPVWSEREVYRGPLGLR
jgi:recombination protein RecA